LRIVISGGTGFLGSPLAEMYAEEGHDVRVLTRSLMSGDFRHDPGTGAPGVTRVGWVPDGKSGPWATVLDGADAVINLAGESIDAGRWTPQRKARLRDSRLLATRSLATAILAVKAPPRVFVSSSAVGFYGPAGDQPLTEASPAGRGFLAGLCEDWEKEAQCVTRAETRLAIVRSGIVLERSGGALARMITPFRWFVGGRIGSGRQYFSWIHRLDWMELVRWMVQQQEVRGAINATAPEPVTNKELARALGRALHRPRLVPAPTFALKLIVGEMADSIVTGQRVIPARAQALGYHFRYPDIDQAFRGIFGD